MLDKVTFLDYITYMNNDLATYIADRNAKTLEWVNAGKGRWATTLVEDLDHWAEYFGLEVSERHHAAVEGFEADRALLHACAARTPEVYFRRFLRL